MSLYKLKKIDTKGNFSLLVLLRPYTVIRFNNKEVKYVNVKTGEVNDTGTLCLYKSICDNNSVIHSDYVKLDNESDWVMENVEFKEIPKTIDEQLKILDTIENNNRLED